MILTVMLRFSDSLRIEIIQRSMMRMAFSLWAIGTVIVLGVAGPAIAADQVRSSPAMARLLGCRSLPAADARLACFDREASALGGSVDRGAVVVIDKAEVKKAQRARFGLSAPGIDLFAGPDGARLSSLAGTVAGAGAGSDSSGKWFVTLADGSRWRQIDDYSLSRSPRAGQGVVITRAAIGSFKMTLAGQASIRVRRER